MNITNERLSEMQPKSIMCETELEALAREVRELRESHSVACETCDGLRDTITKVRAETMTLTRERDELRAEQDRLIKDRDHWAAEVDRLRGVLSREIDTAELEKVEQLTRELAEASRTIDLQSKQIAHQARQCQEIENELDAANIVRDKLTEENKRLLLRLRDQDTLNIYLAEARDFNRRFRGLFAAAIFSDSDPGKEWIRVCRDYDATQTQQPQPTQVELVPWTSETRPKGVVFLRCARDPDRDRIALTWNQCHVNAAMRGWVSYSELLEEWEWSPDGVNWQRCGVRR